MKKYKPKSKEELRALCENQEINLGDIDVSLIMDMSELFCKPYVLERENWSGIESWDMSGVESLEGMFEGCKYQHSKRFFELQGIKGD